ncbi:MAG: hypothetical protein AAFV93_09390 [Chloroflexota bacterium]
MKNKVVRYGLGTSIILILIVASYHVMAQTASVACERWNSFGTVTIPDPGSVGFTGLGVDAGDSFSVTFSLATGTSSATVSLDVPNGNPVAQRTFTSGTVTLSYTNMSNGILSIAAVNSASSNGDVVASNFICTSPSIGGGGNNANNATHVERGFTDGRINHRDAAAPIVIYSYVDTSGRGFDIYHADGRFAYRATANDLANAPLYDSANDIRISTVAGGGYQITAPQYNGKTYVMQVDAPLANIGYTSYEQD